MRKRVKTKTILNHFYKTIVNAKRSILYLVAVLLFLLVLTVFGLLYSSNNRDQKFLVTFYDNGKQQSILTQARTVREALRSAGIAVSAQDRTDPTIDSKFESSYADVIIYRSRPVIVIDGNTRQSIMTVAQSPNEMLSEAKLAALGTEDKTTISKGSLATNGAVVLTIERAKVEPVEVKPAFVPRPDALTRSKGAQIFVDSSGVAHRETYYDLPMNIVIGLCGLGGSYTVREDGAKVDQDGYVLVAAGLRAYPRCTIVETSLGLGKVYDTGGFALRHPYGFDLATDWTNYDGR